MEYNNEYYTNSRIKKRHTEKIADFTRGSRELYTIEELVGILTEKKEELKDAEEVCLLLSDGQKLFVSYLSEETDEEFADRLKMLEDMKKREIESLQYLMKKYHDEATKILKLM
jgi:hypothetical protein